VTLTIKLEQERVKVDHNVKHLKQRTFHSNATVWTHTDWTDCLPWTTKLSVA